MALRPDADRQSETEGNMTKVSDSGYSTACSNSQSQRSGSSKSIHSSVSSKSSGYRGHRLPVNNEFPTPGTININELKRKKKNEKHRPTCFVIPTETTPDAPTEEMETGVAQSKHPKEEAMEDVVVNNESEEVLNHLVASQTFQVLGKLNAREPLESELESPPEAIADSAIVRQGAELIADSLRTERPINEEFCLVVSMTDGKVLYTTPALTEVLGFPKDMWLGRSFIDFIHPKDKVAFATHITSGVANPGSTSDAQRNVAKHPRSTFFCCLRKYRGLKNTGFGVKNKDVQYQPFHLSLSFREATSNSSGIFLIITANAVKTAYNGPDETFRTPKFSTRQLSDCVVSHVDAEAVSYLGYLPHDIVGRSVFDFYHPEDTHLVKEMYETILEGQGSASRSKPYRFRAQNGSYVVLETEWSSFVNPWSKKMEFAIGQHSVLRGPPNPDVFAPPSPDQQFPDELILEKNRVQEAIKFMLNESYAPMKKDSSQRCRDLAHFIKSLMDEITIPNADENNDAIKNNHSLSERNSVMLGEISPHHEDCSESPPSYSQLNYKENLQRFFESKPKTAIEGDENSEPKMPSCLHDEADKSRNSKSTWFLNGSRTCSGSGSGLSSGSIHPMASIGTHRGSYINYEPLTMAVLYKHNEDMEKIMLRKHKDLRSNNGGKEPRVKKSIEKSQESHGLKRTVSASWEADKILKHRHVDEHYGETNIDVDSPASLDSLPVNLGLWPLSQTTLSAANTAGVQITGMIPVYYIPADDKKIPGLHMGGPLTPSEHPGSPIATIASPVTPASSLNAFNMFQPTPMMYSPMMLSRSYTSIGDRTAEGKSLQRPVSQANSVRVEAGSPTASVHMVSNESRIGISLAQRDSLPMPSFAAKCHEPSGTRNATTCDESSYSSFSSTLRTDESWKYSDAEPGLPGLQNRPPLKKTPPWMENVSLTPELVYRYQLESADLSSVLDRDLQALRKLNQPSLVESQLQQMYVDLELAGLSTRLDLDGDSSSSGNSSGEERRLHMNRDEKRQNKRQYNYGQLVMIYEENMPLPQSATSIPSVN